MKNEAEILSSAIAHIKDFIERNGYSASFETGSSNGFDGVLTVPELQLRFVMEVKTKFFASDIPRLEPLESHLSSNETLIVVTEVLTKGTFDACRSKDLFILDVHGNGRFRAGKCFYERFVATASPGKPRTSGTPFTAKAVRIVRTLLSNPTRPWFQSEIVKATGISQGYASNTLKMLRADGYISIIADCMKVEAPERLLEDWLAHYRFDRHQRRQYAISFSTYDNGLEKLAGELGKLGIKFAFTGWSGSHLRAPYGTSNQLMAYVISFPEEHQSTVLFPVKDKGNAVLYVPQDDGVFKITNNVKGFPVVSDAQLYLDLRQMPGRASEQAEVLKEKYLSFKN
ncbi:MAG: type IV toxin-antitoxin system AbiEi family antitoxin [Victivallales bacterium]